MTGGIESLECKLGAIQGTGRWGPLRAPRAPEREQLSGTSDIRVMNHVKIYRLVL